MEETNKLHVKCLMIFVIIVLLGMMAGVLYLFYLLATVITVVGSSLLFCFMLFLIVRLILRLSVFPGSFWLWKRSIESHFCKEMCLQLLQKVQDLRICVEIVLDKSSECEKIEFFERAIDATTYAKRMISTIIDMYNIESERKTLTKSGSSLHTLLLEFQSSLSSIKIIVDSKSLSLWDFIDEAQEGKEWAGIVSEEYPSNLSALHAHSCCLNLEKRLIQSCGNTNLFQKLHRFLFDNTLGTYNQMRLELENRYNSEQIWLNSGSISIDCMYFTNPDAPDSATMILCSPNASLYEFSYYQSEWLDYYLSVGVNVFLWNYRGYGRSKGSPSPNALKKDGEAVFEYLRSTKKVKILGVHGESLGGIVAVHLAKACEVDFLFVDRSFGKLNEVVKYSFGKWANFALKAVARWDLDASLEYLYVNCYKVLSADPHDLMINDLASMKSSVAVKFIETRGLEIAEGITPAQLDVGKYFHILRATETADMLKSVKILMDYVIKHVKSDNERSPGLFDLTSTSSYQPLGKDLEALDEETISSLVYRVYNVLDSIDAGGKPLSSIPIDTDNELSIKLWLMVLDIWGSFLPIEPADINLTRARALEKLQDGVIELRQTVVDHEYSTNPIILEVCKECKVLEKSLARIIIYLKNQVILERVNGELSPGRDELSTCRHHFEYEKAGYLLPLSCGHSGRYNAAELSLLETHLARIGFIK